MYRRLGAPGTITTFYKLVPIERPQAGQCRYGQTGTFIQSQRPAIIDCFENRRRAFDNSNFFFHSSANIPQKAMEIPCDYVNRSSLHPTISLLSCHVLCLCSKLWIVYLKCYATRKDWPL